MSSAPNSSSGVKILATNRKARHHYHILENIEAGIELRGSEVKSIRAGEVSLQEGYATVENGEVYLHGVRIQPYSHARAADQDPDRPRRLLLHRSQINRLLGLTAIKGHTLLPLDLHLRNGRIKVELGLARGKQLVDKRETLKRREADREARRAMARARK
ncbi:MAG: SsrA-binding protein SmpB [Kiritimatiellae bacterium]|nr:SsrA-binding protein SmpB [Kiritimatiellia bacterium]MDW8458770.1 SsrA-binding protein SmpB [Verrucomicrobiota bacterium]